MPLAYLLYRCPRCGQDPTLGKGDQVWCPSCATSYRRGKVRTLILVREEDGRTWEVPSHDLTAAIHRLGGPEPRALDARGRLRYTAEVEVRRAKAEAPVRFRGRLLGFAESLGPRRRGTLEITDSALRLLPEEEVWDLLTITAVQTTSSSLQISPREGGVVQFKFKEDSPRRWEDLLKGALRKAYRRAGRGEITEFQPRIRALPGAPAPS